MTKPALLVVKIGGNIVDDEQALNAFLDDFAAIEGNKILVHGGGKAATALSKQLGIEPQMVNGRRITGDEDIKVVTMVYAGWLNKKITAALQSKNQKAIGLSGADAALIPAVKRPVNEIDYGWVGDILLNEINTGLFDSLLAQKLSPVIAPVSCDTAGNLLNINADTIATYIAVVMSRQFDVTLALCFEKKGVLLDIEDEHSFIEKISSSDFAILKEKGVISNGMLPKLDNAFFAAQKGVQQVVIGHAGDIKRLVEKKEGVGTRVMV